MRTGAHGTTGPIARAVMRAIDRCGNDALWSGCLPHTERLAFSNPRGCGWVGTYDQAREALVFRVGVDLRAEGWSRREAFS